MRQVRDILRLHFDAGLSTRAIGVQLGIGATTVRDALEHEHPGLMSRREEWFDSQLELERLVFIDDDWLDTKMSHWNTS
ncbi:hypothetical protein CQ054_21075 [Ochrobactrum sp. MYb29]|nr:hypothetical protein CWE02_09615 [Brucella pituitosa]PRA80519.1 hypothetical protein CQ054_21075 [Ochrobactrum sp. MYb29]TCQ72945.1 hypothetical protein EDF68_1208 [Ochrobactrum sp. BH3]